MRLLETRTAATAYVSQDVSTVASKTLWAIMDVENVGASKRKKKKKQKNELEHMR